jgi:hypothetical protein
MRLPTTNYPWFGAAPGSGRLNRNVNAFSPVPPTSPRQLKLQTLTHLNFRVGCQGPPYLEPLYSTYLPTLVLLRKPPKVALSDVLRVSSSLPRKRERILRTLGTSSSNFNLTGRAGNPLSSSTTYRILLHRSRSKASFTCVRCRTGTTGEERNNNDSHSPFPRPLYLPDLKKFTCLYLLKYI